MLRLFCLGAVLLISGCGGGSGGPRTVDASGVVTLDGAPVDKAQVLFINEATQMSATATTNASGEFSLFHNGEKKGAVPGTYKVQVSKTLLESQGDGGAEVTISHGLPKKYASYVTSELSSVVPDEGTDSLKLELSSK